MKSVRWVLAAIVAGLLVLSGCSNPGANVAATVNGVAIPVDRVEGPAQVIGAGGQVAEVNARVLSYAILGEIARGLASEQGIQLTGEPRTALLAQDQDLASLGDNPQASSLVDDFVDLNLVVGRVGQAAVLARVAATSVQVNPRYGSWSAESAGVVQSGGQLSLPWTKPSAPA
ncbi:MAG: hypothetical protein QM619_08480 [Micropruina sp.]|uniref:hypothetical protein n=1 Tax=Micropruina sp. TaxID=2737536 RepID=UPI0039E2E02A